MYHALLNILIHKNRFFFHKTASNTIFILDNGLPHNGLFDTVTFCISESITDVSVAGFSQTMPEARNMKEIHGFSMQCWQHTRRKPYLCDN